MARVLIAGCGYVGSAAAKLFAEAGWEVHGWTRTDPSAARAGDERKIALCAVDITDLEMVRRNAFPADVVVHCASSGTDSYRRIYRDAAANLAACFPKARLVFTSSTRVYAQRDGSFVSEESVTEPDSDEGKILREAEEIVIKNNGIVLRVGGIYGPARSFLLRGVINGTAVATDRIVNQVHRDDVAAAISLVAQKRFVKPPRIFNVVDDNPVPRTEILQWLSARLNLPLSKLSAPPEQKRGRSNKRVSNAKLRALGWVPAYPTYREGFDHSVLPALEKSPA